MHIHRLRTVDAFIAFDFDDAPRNAGGTRLAADVTEEEAALLARAMTYKFAVVERATGGAKGAVRAAPAERDDAMRRYLTEIRPMVEAGRFLTGSDLGTSDADFEPFRDPTRTRGPMSAEVDGVAMEDLVTGYGVATAADVAVGGLAGKTVAIEGFGKVGGGVGREVVRRGGRVVAVSTLHGCLKDEHGLDVELLWKQRAAHGDAFVAECGVPVVDRAELFGVGADVLVPGARTGVIDESVAERIRAEFVIPASNVPYTGAGLKRLIGRGVQAHADFVCNAGAVIGFTTPATTTEDVFAAVGSRIGGLIERCRDHGDGPYAAACSIALEFLRTWRGENVPTVPPLA